MPRDITFPKSEAPKRLENFLRKRFPVGYVRKLFRKNGVRLNGKRCGPNEVARPGDRVELFIPFERPATTRAGPALTHGFELIFEDDHLLVIDKRPGIAVHEGKEILRRHSLLGMMEAAFCKEGIRPRLVHRIDKETSGLLVIAKDDETAEALQTAYAAGEVEKEYLTLVVGRLYPARGMIDTPLPGRGERLVPALTLYKVEKEFSDTMLVRVRTKTGRMHQIRLHFAQIGHPVVMDNQHGDFTFNKRFRKAHGLKRQFLHASSIAFDYRGKKWSWTAPLPEDLNRTLSSLQTKI